MKLEAKAAKEVAAKEVMATRRDPTSSPALEPLIDCPFPNARPVVRAQFHVGVVVKGLSQTSLHRDGTGNMGKAQLWMVDGGVYVHFLRERVANIFVPWANVEFVQLTEHPA